MNHFRRRQVVLLFMGMLMIQMTDAVAGDYLRPVNLKENQAYRRLLGAKLDLTPFNCGRSLVLPPLREREASTLSLVG